MASVTGVNERVERLRQALEQPLLVTHATNVFYLAGFRSSNAALFVDEERTLLFTDFRYAAAARAVEGVEFVQTKRALLQGVGDRIDGRVAFEATALTYAEWQTLADAGLELVPTRGVVEKLRAVKDDAELAAIREASRVTDLTYAALAEERFVGRSERDVAWRMEELFHEHGAHDLSFPPSFASGERAANPHTRPGDDVIEPNTLVVIDAGCVIDGYASDCTRTFATGDLPDELARAYDVCARAQREALAAVRPGAIGRDVDAVSRRPIDDAGWGENYGHGLGHGVGLMVHEAPTLRPESQDVLAPRNVVTVEPGIYLEGTGGVRIEDLVVVTDDGCDVLTQFTKELVTVR